MTNIGRASGEASRVGLEIDPGLPLVRGRKAVATRLFGGLADSAPDRWGRTLLA